MSTRNTTTIEIARDTWQELNARKKEPGEAFNDVVDRLLEQ
jgi:predicted CopG family antitoxin